MQPLQGAPEDPSQVSAQGWEIPVVVDGEETTVTGEWLWQPADTAIAPAAEAPRDDGSSVPLAGVVLAAGLAGAVGLRLAVRRRTAPGAALGSQA